VKVGDIVRIKTHFSSPEARNNRVGVILREVYKNQYRNYSLDRLEILWSIGNITNELQISVERIDKNISELQSLRVGDAIVCAPYLNCSNTGIVWKTNCLNDRVFINWTDTTPGLGCYHPILDFEGYPSSIYFTIPQFTVLRANCPTEAA